MMKYALFTLALAVCVVASPPEVNPPKPKAAWKPCTKIGCMNECPDGFKMDAKGCPTCECNKICAMVDLRCDDGVEVVMTMVDGCPLHECKKPEATKCPPTCRMLCPMGFEKDENGCDTCKCKKTEATKCPPTCRRLCFNGFEKDENGCDTCKCKKTTKCPPTCMRLCFNGFEKDENGCNTCKCKKICPMAKIYCPNGKYDKKMVDGCPLYECKTKCPPTCRRFCFNGFEKDENGCDKCKCKQGPRGDETVERMINGWLSGRLQY